MQDEDSRQTARPSGPYRRPKAAILALLVPLALSLLATFAWPAAPRVRPIALDAAPDTVALDPGASRAFVASARAGAVTILDLSRGRVLRRVPVGAPTTLAPLALALAPHTHHLFVADRTDLPVPSVVEMLDSRGGDRLATVPVGQEAAALAVDARHERVLVADETDGTLSLLDTRTGTLRRTVPLGLLPLALAVDARANRAFALGLASAGAVPLSAVIAGGLAGLLGVLDTRTGALLHVTAVGSGPSALAVDPVSRRVFVACAGDATVRVLDASSGAPLRTVRLDAAPSALAVDARRGRVYVASAAAGTLSLLDARSGTLLHTLRLDPFASVAYALPDVLAVDEARDRVYLTTYGPLEQVDGALALRGEGTLYVLDARTGAPLRRIAVGVAPRAIAVDEASGRVVVGNGGGMVLRAPAGWGEPWIGRLRAWLPWLGHFATPAPVLARVPGSVSVIETGA
jgi:DNA-binding beta-propeller fold protein YncE